MDFLATAASNVVAASAIPTRLHVVSRNVRRMERFADPPLNVARARAPTAFAAAPPASLMASPATETPTAAMEFVRTILAAPEHVCPRVRPVLPTRNAAWASSATVDSAACLRPEMAAHVRSILAALCVRNAS